jgi:hypothetical protein
VGKVVGEHHSNVGRRFEVPRRGGAHRGRSSMAVAVGRRRTLAMG